MKTRRLHPLEVSDASEILHLKLWDGSLFDYSLNGNSGTEVGTDIAPAYPGFLFNGTDDYIKIADDAVWDDTTLSIVSWVKLDAAFANLGYVCARATSAATSWRLWIDTHVSGRKVSITGSDTGSVVTSTGGIPRGTWTFLVGTWNGTTGKIYINAIEDGSDTIVAISDTAIKPTFGCRWNNEAAPNILFPLKGTLDDVRIYNRVMTAIEIRDLYEQTRWRYGA